MSIPNLVAMTTSERRSPSAAARYSSLCPWPYTSAVSKNVMPASSAASTTSRDRAASMRRPKLLQPSPTRETAGPDVPRLRVSTSRVLPAARCHVRRAPASLDSAAGRLGAGAPSGLQNRQGGVAHRLGGSIPAPPRWAWDFAVSGTFGSLRGHDAGWLIAADVRSQPPLSARAGRPAQAGRYATHTPT